MICRLDERTKLDFYKRVSDNKGVDTEAAIKYLKSAQRKTGKDILKQCWHQATPAFEMTI